MSPNVKIEPGDQQRLYVITHWTELWCTAEYDDYECICELEARVLCIMLRDNVDEFSCVLTPYGVGWVHVGCLKGLDVL